MVGQALGASGAKSPVDTETEMQRMYNTDPSEQEQLPPQQMQAVEKKGQNNDEECDDYEKPLKEKPDAHHERALTFGNPNDASVNSHPYSNNSQISCAVPPN